MRSRDWQALAAATIAGAALRLATIDVQSFWFDEALTAQLLQMPLGDMLGELPERQLTPPLYYVLAWPWAELFGESELPLRLLSALFGIATIPAVWAAARELAGRRVALAATLLTAFNPLLVWYSQEARPYALWVLLSALAFWFFARALRGDATRDLVLWSLFSALALLTHYFAVFLIAPQGLWLLYEWRRRGPVLAAGAPLVAIGLALVPLARTQADHVPTGYISELSFGRRVLGLPEDFLTGFVIGFNTTVEDVLAVLAAPAALLALWLVYSRANGHERRAATVAAGVGGAAVGVPALLAIGGVDYLNTRNVLAAWIPLALLLAVGFAARRTPRAVGIGGAGLLCAIGVATTVAVARDDTLQRSDWRGAADALGDADGPRAMAVPGLVGFVTLELYLPDLRELPPEGAEVTEVDIVTIRNDQLDGGPSAVARAAPPPPPPGFELAEALYEETYVVLRYRADRPVRVTPEAVARTAEPMVGAASLLLEP